MELEIIPFYYDGCAFGLEINVDSKSVTLLFGDWIITVRKGDD